MYLQLDTESENLLQRLALRRGQSRSEILREALLRFSRDQAASGSEAAPHLIVIPKEIRDALHWEAGTRLSLISGTSSVTIKAIPQKTGRRLEDLIGMLRHDGPPLSTEDLCQPVDASADWQASEERSR